jgi:hypothetical protein
MGGGVGIVVVVVVHVPYSRIIIHKLNKEKKKETYLRLETHHASRAPPVVARLTCPCPCEDLIFVLRLVVVQLWWPLVMVEVVCIRI